MDSNRIRQCIDSSRVNSMVLSRSGWACALMRREDGASDGCHGVMYQRINTCAQSSQGNHRPGQNCSEGRRMRSEVATRSIVLFRKILTPVDFSPCSLEAYRVALAL